MKKPMKEHKNEANISEGDDVQSLGMDMSKVEGRMNELLGDLQRTRADFENYRKQVEIQKANAVKMAEFATVHKLLPLLDDIDRAIATYNVELMPVAKSLDRVLKELGLKKIEAGAETEFNPDLHEAVMAEGDGEKEVIGEVLREGYYYKGEVLRPTLVRVLKI